MNVHVVCEMAQLFKCLAAFRAFERSPQRVNCPVLLKPKCVPERLLAHGADVLVLSLHRNVAPVGMPEEVRPSSEVSFSTKRTLHVVRDVCMIAPHVRVQDPLRSEDPPAFRALKLRRILEMRFKMFPSSMRVDKTSSTL
mmetsp:Transcript_13901/g.19304  ORF Transcript_13901/g.19304 Transcript_13901/m.19304 type:complete len:140 (-) Transcript_13901:150-569(-)